MMNRFIAHNMPKIELHCHLDGSVSLPLIQKLMQQEKKEPLGLEELRKKLVAPMDCSSLAEYLEKFELPLGCLQTKEGLSAAAQDLALSAAKEQVKYLEVRFAPAFSMEQGLSVREILESVRDGLKKSRRKSGHPDRNDCLHHAQSGNRKKYCHVKRSAGISRKRCRCL